MARKRSNNQTPVNVTSQRGFISTTRYPQVLRTIQLLQQLEQPRAYSPTRNAVKAPTNKTFHPARLAPLKTSMGTPARFDRNRLRTAYQSPFQLTEPDKVGICQRRRSRREVLHALKRTGKGARARRTYTRFTDFHC